MINSARPIHNEYDDTLGTCHMSGTSLSLSSGIGPVRQLFIRLQWSANEMLVSSLYYLVVTPTGPPEAPLRCIYCGRTHRRNAHKTVQSRSMFDLIVYNGRVVTASNISDVNVWIGIIGEKIVTLSATAVPLDQCHDSIDAKGALVTPGGIDSHVHLEQLQIAPGEDTGDTFYSGTRSAIAGGTTTIIAFANQQRHDESLIPLVEEYHRRATSRTTFTDYSFHIILTKPTKKILDEELPILFEQEGITSIKVSVLKSKWPPG